MHRRDLLRLGAGAAGWSMLAPRGPGDGGVGQDADRMAWWRDARFGMFIHFGLYSTLGGEWKGAPAGSHEWIRNNAKIPHEEYIPLVEGFDPRGFDADAWVAAAKDAGQKYLVVTTKHHEGFSLFDSAVTGYDVMSTPFRRDIMRELADACRRHGIRIGWYYSIMDWYHPDYLPRRDWEQRDATAASFARYVAFMQAQLRELLTNYGDISILWFDGQWERTWNHALGVSLHDYCRAIAPDVVINNRVDGGGDPDSAGGRGPVGDFRTPEQEVPATGLSGLDWESCITMNKNWGWSKFDHDWKSVSELIGLLVETASKGGNLLLNVGPMGDGRFPPQSIDGLRGIGHWMRVNGAAIYGTRATPFADAPVRATLRGTRLNLFIDPWRPGPLLLPGMTAAPHRAYLLADPGAGPLETRATPGGVELRLPERAPGPIWPVVVMEFDEALPG